MNVKIGDIITVTINGIQPYGAFAIIDKETSGLIHISEISEGFVRDVSQFIQLNDRVNVKVIDKDKKTGQVRLSLKAVKSSKRKERNYARFIKTDNFKLGFTSLARILPKWIDEKYKEIEEIEHEIKS